MSSNKKKGKEEKEKGEKRREKLRCFTLKPEHGPRGSRRKSLKPSALSLSWLGATDLASHKCWNFEFIRSPGRNPKSWWSRDPHDLMP